MLLGGRCCQEGQRRWRLRWAACGSGPLAAGNRRNGARGPRGAGRGPFVGGVGPLTAALSPLVYLCGAFSRLKKPSSLSLCSQGGCSRPQHFRGPPLDPRKKLHKLPVLGAPGLDTAL